MTDDAAPVDPADAFGVGGHGWDAETWRAVSPRQHAARDVADALRRLAVVLETTGASVDELDALAVRLGDLADALPADPSSVPDAAVWPSTYTDLPAVFSMHDALASRRSRSDCWIVDWSKPKYTVSSAHPLEVVGCSHGFWQ